MKTAICSICGTKQIIKKKDATIQNHWAKKDVREVSGRNYCEGSGTIALVASDPKTPDIVWINTEQLESLISEIGIKAAVKKLKSGLLAIVVMGLLFGSPIIAHAQDGLLVSDTAAESSARHFEMRVEEQQAAPMAAAPLGGYTDEKFGDSAPAGTPMPGYAEPQGFSAPLFKTE